MLRERDRLRHRLADILRDLAREKRAWLEELKAAEQENLKRED